MNVTLLGIKALQDVFEHKKYVFFTNNDYNLNIFGIRKHPGTVNKFDDLIGLAYKVDNEWYLKLYDATTDPGLYYLNNPMNVKGTAALVEGQYRGCFQVGLHKEQYEAVVQFKELPVYRDANRDSKLDLVNSTVDVGMHGINIHRATANKGQKSTQVDKWSAGCQVIASSDDFRDFMSIVNISKKKYGNSFTYTLLNERDFLV